MTIYLFLGPTLSNDDARAELDAALDVVCLPPAAQGDVYRAALDHPRAIGIVDGYFERMPAIWHKEILWAMAQGIRVYGSASMGALRAAELASFGMIGVGAIFESFRDETLEDDDEVAVAHGSAADGYRALSEAMVNVRATLRAAEAQGVIATSTMEALVRVGKGLFYAERSWPMILGRAGTDGVRPHDLEALRAWLPRGRVNQKRDDAIAMLRAMRARLSDDTAAPHVTYSFEHTDAWEHLRQRAAGLRLSGDTAHKTVPLDALEDELRLEGTAPAARRAALTRALALEEAARQRLVVSDEAIEKVTAAFCAERGIAGEAELARWLASHGVPRDEFTARMREEAQLHWVSSALAPQVSRSLASHLQLTGDYGRLVSRAREKARSIGEIADSTLADLTSEGALWSWYFGERLKCAVPDDLEQYARAAGFDDAHALRRAVLRERAFAGRARPGDEARRR